MIRTLVVVAEYLASWGFRSQRWYYFHRRSSNRGGQCDGQCLDNLLSGLAAVFAGAFSMAGGEYVSVSTQKDTEEAAVARERELLEKNPDIARQSLYAAYVQNGDVRLLLSL